MFAFYIKRLTALVALILSCFLQSVSAQSITGHLVVCRGASRTTLSIAASGGVWSSGDVTKATIDASTGEVTGVAAGTATISYTILPSTVFTAVVTVNSYVMNPIGFSLGDGARCTGGLTATCTVSPMIGNAWTSSDPSVATVSTSGLVTPSASNTGTTTISYRHGYGNCYVTREVTVSATPTLTATTPVCNYLTQTVTATPAGGTWTSSNLPVGTIGSTTGVFSSLSGGGTTCLYTAPNGCKRSVYIVVSSTPAAITGTRSACVGNGTTLYCSTTGGTWSSADPGVATISPTTGVVTPVSAGTALISYTNGIGCAATAVVTIYPAVSPIAGPDVVCLGQNITLTHGTPGGYWTSSAPSRATITTYTGLVTGIATGTARIYYVTGGGCSTNKVVTVNPSPAAISGSPYVCMSETLPLTHPATGGTWTSSTSNATIDISTGMVTGVTAGSATITYTISPGCIKTFFLIIRATPGATTALSPLCPGTNTTLVNATSGGTWTSSNPSVATIASSTGVVTSIAAGTTEISYVLTATGCGMSSIITVNPLPDSITGPGKVCVGSAITLASATAGGTWASSNVAVAPVGSTGTVSGILAGTASVSYTLATGCRRSRIVTVDTLPGVITGTLTVCEGATTSLASSGTGGSWSSSDPSRASVTSTGLVTGSAPGTATITYTLGTGCLRTATVTVNPLPRAGVITGAGTLCLGGTITLTDTTSGGVWSSSNTSVATVNSSGVVSAVALGSTVISYTVTNGCGTSTATASVFVGTGPAMPSIAGDTSVCAGSVLPLTSSATGGMWESSDTTIATVNSSGDVMGISAGSVIISYTVTNACGSATATMNVTVRPLPDAGAITSATVVCAGDTLFMSSTVPGGIWSSFDSSIATADSSGMVVGVSAGSAVISYTATNSCGSDTATITIAVYGAPYVSAIGGASSVCAGSSITLTDTVSGGVWASSDTSVATVSSAGIVTGVSPGIATITYSLTTSCGTTFATKSITVGAVPTVYTVTGGGNHCGTGVAIGLSGSQAGMLYSLYLGATLVDTATGSGSAISFGMFSTVGTYYAVAGATCTAAMMGSASVTDTGSLAPISGTSTVCQYHPATLSHATSGGTWGSSNSAVATVSSSGVVTTIASGSVIITYTVGSCYVVKSITIVPGVYPQTITGGGSYCSAGGGASIGLSGSQTGVNYQLYYGSSTFGGAVGGTGSAISFGVFTMSGTYSVIGTNTSTACTNSMSGSAVVSFVGFPTAGTISGPTTVSGSSSITLSSTVGGGTWSSSNVSIAFVGPTSGIVTGLSSGSVLISYSVTNACGTAVATYPVSVTSPRPGITTESELQYVGIYPNPTKGAFTVKSYLGGVATLCATDGREIGHFNVSVGETHLNLPQEITPGIYSVRIDGNDGSRQVVKLVYQP